MAKRKKIIIKPRHSEPPEAPTPVRQKLVIKQKSAPPAPPPPKSWLEQGQQGWNNLSRQAQIGVGAGVFLLLLLLLLFLWPAAPQPVETSTPNNKLVLSETGVQELLQQLGQTYQVMEKGEGRLEKRQSVSSFLEGFQVPTSRSIELEQLAAEEGVPVLQAGQRFMVFAPKARPTKAEYLLYFLGMENIAVFKLTPPLQVRRVEQDVRFFLKSAAAIIDTSLYQAIQETSIPLSVLVQMEEALRSDVDFYHVQRNDRFKVLYEQQLSEDKIARIGALQALYFEETSGQFFYAFRFTRQGKAGYYDENGRPMQATFLKSPLKYGVITSHYNLKRVHPVVGTVRPHYGIDYAAKEGTPIYAVADGEIELATNKQNNGNYIRIIHDPVYKSQYLHMSGFAPGIEPGRRVQQGEVIGYVGQTGLATGPHVCFRFWKGDEQVDYLKENPRKPVQFTESEMVHFIAHRDSLKRQLDEMNFSGF